MFVAELNGLELWAADVGNAYLEAYTKEKVYIIAGPEFEKLEGHTHCLKRSSMACAPQGPGGMTDLLMLLETLVFIHVMLSLNYR